MDFDGPEWQAAIGLLRHGGTVVVLMGLGRAEAIANRLVHDGCAASLPAAMVSQATWPGEAVRFGVLGNIASKVAGLNPPALLILGNVAAEENARNRTT
jgi:uroporphyrin-III C-methyltransferase/precorrin-2 dehydrogenase/sirohydrochlorin ferrochelatase